MRSASVTLAVACAACGHGGSSADPCARAVGHIMELTLVGPPPSKDEHEAIVSIQDTILAACRTEGLSAAQADCILAAHPPDWDDRLRTCPAFAAKPASWVMLRPPRDERIRARGLTPAPDGPRESPVRFVELEAAGETTCGLAPDHTIRCWGRERATPKGTFTTFHIDNEQVCGQDAVGTLHCALADPTFPDHTPAQPFQDFAIGGYQGCGVGREDGRISCWTSFDDAPLSPPIGRFTRVVIDRHAVCALDTDRHVTCFGPDFPTPPTDSLLSIGRGFCGVTGAGKAVCWPHGAELGALATTPLTSISCGFDCCGIGADHQLVCIGTRLGPSPTGSFDLVAVFGGHACAVRTNGGTVCWGENDAGECNVPQQ